VSGFSRTDRLLPTSHRLSMGLDNDWHDRRSSHRLPMGRDKGSPGLLPGTLDLLILKTLVRGAMHGYGIAEQLRVISEDVLQVGESSLYPALQRLLLQGWVKAEWGASDNNRRARYYTLTASGRKRLASERDEFDRLILAIHKVLEA
jgi:PadR family transcriptional regulator